MKKPTTPEPKQLPEQKLREDLTAMTKRCATAEANLRVVRNMLTKLTGQITTVLGE